jgi:hypothetical protein
MLLDAVQIACTDANGNSLVLSVMFASAGNLDNASVSALFTPGLYLISKL